MPNFSQFLVNIDVCADPNTQTVPAYPQLQQPPYPVQQPNFPQQLQGTYESVIRWSYII